MPVVRVRPVPARQIVSNGLAPACRGRASLLQPFATSTRSPRPGRAASTHANKLTSATPSRRCAARAPATSAAVLGLRRLQGSVPDDLGARGVEAVRDKDRGRCPDRRDPSPSASSAGPKPSGAATAPPARAGHARPPRPWRGRQEIRAPVGMQDGVAESERRHCDVGAAHVEEPRDEWQRQHHGGEVTGGEAACELGPLVGGRAPASSTGYSDDRPAGGRDDRPTRGRRGSRRRDRPIRHGRGPRELLISPEVWSRGSKPTRPPPGSVFASQSTG